MYSRKWNKKRIEFEDWLLAGDDLELPKQLHKIGHEE